MKKVNLFISVLVLVFFAAFGIVSCGGTPPPAPIAPPAAEALPAPVPPPPPPPPPKQPGAPELSVSLSPQYFSPDGDGVDDNLTVTITCKDDSPIDSWSIEIREPVEPYRPFSEWSGKGDPPPQIVWDGRSSKGELVQSATDYPYSLTVTNTHGLSSTVEGLIEVDVLVIRDGDRLKVQVPSIVFGSNTGGFTGLNDRILRNNDYILRRIATVLNKFNTYKVSVEGHANLTAATESARKLEQERELQPLSEQRAKFVVDYLIKLGVDGSRLSAVGIGGAQPIAAYSDRDNWWKNRRVEFILIK